MDKRRLLHYNWSKSGLLKELSKISRTNSYCVGQKHYSGIKNTVGEITFKKKTSKEGEILNGQCSVCSRKNSLIVSDSTIEVERPRSLFKSLGRNSANW